MNRVDPLIEGKREELNGLCKRFRVQRFEVFGSAADGSFDSATSDLDFLVEFLPLQPDEHFDTYFGLLEALGNTFQRRVDLVMTRAIKNRYFLKAVNQTRLLLYAA